MNRTTIVAITILVLAAFTAAAAAPASLAGRGAFLNTRANSVKALVQQVRSNPTVADRYAKHFHMSRQAVARYFESSLRLTTLKRARTVTIFYVSKNGTITSGKRLLPAGSKVFATKQGQVVLEWRCGNPIASRLPAQIVEAPKPVVQPKPVVETPPVTTPPAAETPAVTAETPTVVPQVAPPTEVPVVGPEVVAQVPPVTSVLPSVETLSPAPVVTPVVPTIEPPAAVVTAPVPSVPPVIAAGGGGFPFILPLLIGGAVLGGGGGGGGTPPPPAEVPEPGALIALSMGLSSAALALRRRKL